MLRTNSDEQRSNVESTCHIRTQNSTVSEETADSEAIFQSVIMVHLTEAKSIVLGVLSNCKLRVGMYRVFDAKFDGFQSSN
jgi:hypothetical protein